MGSRRVGHDWATSLSLFTFLHWGKKWQPTPVPLPGESQGLVGCCLWGHTESDTTERLHFHFSLSCIGGGNGNPLQCSCLENPRGRGAWWAAVYGIAQSRTQLKRLSSSSSLGLERQLTFSSPVATAELSKFTGILSAALSQHHLLGFEIAQLEFHHLHYLCSWWCFLRPTLCSRMSGSTWVITPSWLSGSWKSFYTVLLWIAISS